MGRDQGFRALAAGGRWQAARHREARPPVVDTPSVRRHRCEECRGARRIAGAGRQRIDRFSWRRRSWDFYWSSETDTGDPEFAYGVNFADGSYHETVKADLGYVLAVRQLSPAERAASRS